MTRSQCATQIEQQRQSIASRLRGMCDLELIDVAKVQHCAAFKGMPDMSKWLLYKGAWRNRFSMEVASAQLLSRARREPVLYKEWAPRCLAVSVMSTRKTKQWLKNNETRVMANSTVRLAASRNLPLTESWTLDCA
eukprot:6352928-Amphidinium_carterae.1